MARIRDGMRRGPRPRELSHPILPSKAPAGVAVVTVPQTDTGGRGEDPKALERTTFKELGKMTP